MFNPPNVAMTRRGFAGALAALPLAAAAARARAATTSSPGRLLFAQPNYSNGIAPNFWVQGAAGPALPTGSLFLQSNQPNPFTKTGLFTPVTWDAGRYTGLSSSTPGTQLGMFNTLVNSANGHTIAQIAGGTMGGFIYSPDLVHGSATNENGTAGMKQMICPSYHFPTSPLLFPFAGNNSGLALTMNFQVPVATAASQANVSNSYATSAFLLVHKTTGARISYSAKIFSFGSNPTKDGIGFDIPTQSVVIGALVLPTSRYNTIAVNSALQAWQPWTGWRTFTYTVTTANVAAALADVSKVMPGALPSTNPADYYLSTWHGNYETHYTPQQPSTLGWSMSGLKVYLL